MLPCSRWIYRNVELCACIAALFVFVLVFPSSRTDKVSTSVILQPEKSTKFGKSSKCGRSEAWYGQRAYPVRSNRSESWKWVVTFVKHVTSNSKSVEDAMRRIINPIRCHDCGDASAGATDWISVRQAWSATENSSSPQLGRRIQAIVETAFCGKARNAEALVEPKKFPGLTTSALEESLVERRMEIVSIRPRILEMPRLECFPHLCDSKNRPSTALRTEPAVLQADTVFMNFHVVDLYDVERMVANLTANFLVLICTMEYPSEKQGEDFLRPVYDFLHELFFTLNWIPVAADGSTCGESHPTPKCQFWTIWETREPGVSGRFMPPAGDGTPQFEIQRIASIVRNPDVGACLSRQGFGGTWEKLGFVDGQWTVCLDRLPLDASCLVYSFGIGDNWSFDDAMHDLGCHVYSFDPSVRKASRKRNTRHWFYKWGLGSEMPVHDPSWILLSYEELRQRLQHQKPRVTVLKMDAEGVEWDFLDPHLAEKRLTSVDQFVFEIHGFRRGNWREMIKKMALLLFNLEILGFALFNARVNPNGFKILEYNGTRDIDNKDEILLELSYIRCVK